MIHLRTHLGTEAKLRAEIDRKMNGTTLIIIAQLSRSIKYATG